MTYRPEKAETVENGTWHTTTNRFVKRKFIINNPDGSIKNLANLEWKFMTYRPEKAETAENGTWNTTTNRFVIRKFIINNPDGSIKNLANLEWMCRTPMQTKLPSKPGNKLKFKTSTFNIFFVLHKISLIKIKRNCYYSFLLWYDWYVLLNTFFCWYTLSNKKTHRFCFK